MTKSTRAGPDVVIRSYRSSDLPAVMALLTASLGGGPAGTRRESFFTWKHLENPFGPSLMLVAEQIVGLRAFMRWIFEGPDGPIRAVRAVDTATHPKHQGKGIFSILTTTALRSLRGDAALVFNTPNEKSLPGYLKMGWRTVGVVPVLARVRRPVRFARGFRSLHAPNADAGSPETIDGSSAAEALRDHATLASLLAEASAPRGRWTTPLTSEYLSWRYGAGAGLDYRVVQEANGDGTAGIGIFRVRPRGRLSETTISQLIVPDGDVPMAARLLRRMVAAAPVDHVTASFPRGSDARRASTRCGFIPTRTGVTMVVNPIAEGLAPDPLRLSSWAFSLGDVEVF